jgi:hypothetical protein
MAILKLKVSDELIRIIQNMSDKDLRNAIRFHKDHLKPLIKELKDRQEEDEY